MKERILEVAIEHTVEVLIDNHLQVAVGRKCGTRCLLVLIQRAQEHGHAIGMADVPTGSGIHLLLRGQGKFITGYTAVVVVGKGSIVAVEIAGAANPQAFEVFSVRIIRSLALKEADTRLYGRAEHGD